MGRQGLTAVLVISIRWWRSYTPAENQNRENEQRLARLVEHICQTGPPQSRSNVFHKGQRSSPTLSGTPNSLGNPCDGGMIVETHKQNSISRYAIHVRDTGEQSALPQAGCQRIRN